VTMRAEVTAGQATASGHPGWVRRRAELVRYRADQCLHHM